MNTAEWDFVRDFIAENRERLTPDEQRFIAYTTFGLLSPTAACRRIGYRSPGTMARQIMDRPHVANLLLAFRELCVELLREIEREEGEYE